MAFSGGYISVSRAIESVLRDTDYQNEISFNDIAEWTAEAIDKIGARIAYEEKTTSLTVEDYRTALPSSVISIVSIRDADSNIPLISTSDEFAVWNYDNVDGDASNVTDVSLYPAYRLANGYLFTNFKDGTLNIVYTTYMLCDKGFPMIPDKTTYVEAIKSYIIYKIDKKLWRKGKLARAIYEDSEREWLFYVNSGFTSMVTPSPDQAESLKNQLLKIVSDTDAHLYGFKHLNKPTVKRF
jgi:hypothetical protein